MSSEVSDVAMILHFLPVCASSHPALLHMQGGTEKKPLGWLNGWVNVVSEEEIIRKDL